MKSLALAAVFALSLGAQAMSFSLPSISSSDFAATSAKAQSVAEKKAELFAADLGVEVLSVDEMTQSASALKASYLVSTDTDCKFVVSVGLFFRSKIESTTNCK